MRSDVTSAPPQKAPEDRSTEFVAVQGGTEGTSAESLLVAAYLVMWAVLLGLLLLSWRRQSRLETRLATLDQKLRQGAGKT